MSIFTSPILEINLANLVSNYKYLQKISKNSVAAAVVKDDAYGLGAVEVANALYEKAGCRHFFVAHAIEGAAIALKVKCAEIYVLQGIGEDSLPYFKKHKLIPVISSRAQLEFWRKNKIGKIKPIINIETGLNRLGFREEFLGDIDENEFSMVMSHLACADEPDHFMNKRQLDKFLELKKKFFPNIPSSLSASDGTFLGKEFQFDMVRLGAAVYGINTTPYHPKRMKTVIKVKAPVLQVCIAKRGDYIGYSASYCLKKDKRIAILSIGYGDGLMRSLSNTKNILGRVSMDNIVIDADNLKNIKPGDFVNILDDKYDVDAMGEDAGTIGYEVMLRIGHGKRFIRKYI